MKTIIIAAVLISIATIAEAQFRYPLTIPQILQQQQHRDYQPRQRIDNQTIIDNRPNKYGEPSVIYNRHGNVTTGSDGTICVETGSTTVCN
jgi:hypothetical protein